MTPTDRPDAGRQPRPHLRIQPMFHRVLNAGPEDVRQALADLRARFEDAVDADTMGRLELVLAEVMNNVAEHACAPGATPGLMHLCVVMHDSGLSCAITDHGNQLPPDCLRPRGLPAMDPLDLPEGGFGWFLIQGLTHSLCYYREDHRNCLAFTVPWQQLS